MDQDVSRRPLTAKARVWSDNNPLKICDGQGGTGTGYSLSAWVSACLFRYNEASNPSLSTCSLIGRTKGWRPGTFQNSLF